MSILLFLSVVFRCSYCLCKEEAAYKVEFRGIKNNDLLNPVRDLSQTLELSSRPAGSISMLRKRVREDIDLFQRFLKSEGYFKAEIRESIETNKSPWLVAFDFIINRRFILESADISFTDDIKEEIRRPDLSQAGIVLKQPYRSKDILDGEKRLLLLLQKQGFPYPVVVNRDVVADHDTESVKVHFLFNPGRRAQFGKTSFSGLIQVDPAFLIKLIPWKEGDQYNPGLLTAYYSELMNLGLFSIVRIIETKGQSEETMLVEVNVAERKHNTVSAGVNYHTDEGPGLKFSWENRNLFRHGERLGLNVTLSDYLTTAESTFKKPLFLRRDQSLRFSIQKSYEDPDAYTSDSFSGSIFIDRQLTVKLDTGLGLTYKWSEIDQLGIVNRFSQISLPLHLGIDTSDDLLDPVRGSRFSVKITPFYELSHESLFFNKGIINYRHYLKIMDDPVSILAGSVTFGIIKGAGHTEIPATERFYAGGGGSVRGYPFQSVGPISGTTPLGGKSLLEMSLESRWRITKNMGLVLFLDGGSAFTERPFGRGEDIRWGTGMGFRYFTPIGPLRLDIGIPLDKREGIDNSFQIYISLGQAF
ncbi:MAG: BamA/TamA family outer membrane protein [Desulfatiglans sp.]|nr:BamA/TamA family outer membrane protein [Desulfatiglans sp.]